MSYALEQPARALAPLAGDQAGHRFLLGTTSLRGPNEIHLVEFHEDRPEKHAIDRLGIFRHDGEVWDLAGAPHDASLLATGSITSDGAAHARLWRLPGVTMATAATAAIDVGSEPRDLTLVAELPGVERPIQRILWEPRELPDPDAPASAVASVATSLVVADRGALHKFALPGGEGEPRLEVQHSLADAATLSALTWDPHHPRLTVAAINTGIFTWDTRSNELTRAVDAAHAHRTCDVSYNPNRPWYVASTGDDGEVRCWDLRRTAAPTSTTRPADGSGSSSAGGGAGGSGGGGAGGVGSGAAVSEPVKVFRGHTSTVHRVLYNPFHDQLLLSGGADRLVCLWRASTISTKPLLGSSGDDVGIRGGRDEGRVLPDVAVRRYWSHKDAVHSIAWSARDAWVFASLSYEGKAAFHTVQAEEKYHIIL